MHVIADEMKSFPKLFTLIQGVCHIGSATVPLIIRPIHQNKPQHPFCSNFIVLWSVFIVSLLSYFAINHIIPQRAGHKIKYALSVWIQKRKFKAGLALATLVSEGEGVTLITVLFHKCELLYIGITSGILAIHSIQNE